MTLSTAFQPGEFDGSGHPKNAGVVCGKLNNGWPCTMPVGTRCPDCAPAAPAAVPSVTLQGFRLVRPDDPNGQSCLSCGNVGDLKGDPRRGWCLTWRHMVGGRGTCNSFTTVHWHDRIKFPPARSASKPPTSAAADGHLVQSGRQDNAGCAPAATDPGAIDGSNPSWRASTVRDTSRASYAALKASGALSRQQALLTAAMERWPYRTFTRQELRAEVGLDINVVTARVKELIDMGALVETGKRICRVKQTEVHELRLAA